MNKKEMLIEYAKEIAEYCDEQGECSENCAFYMRHRDCVCFFDINSDPCKWDFEKIEN